MIAKYIVFSNIISVVSDNILRICIQEPLLISKKFIFLVHILSAYITTYSSDIKFIRLIPENVYVQAEGMLKPMKTWSSTISKGFYKKNCNTKLSAPTARRKLDPNKRVTAKVSLENLLRNVLKENQLWNRAFKSTVW